jgi:16S rRNA (uracil1498-N3)-methyltransferase
VAEAFPSSVAATAHVYLDRIDDECVVSGDEAHHLLRVRRLRVGEVVTGADGHGRWRVYRVESTVDRAVTLHATGDVAREPRLVPELTVACSLTKGDRPELVVQKLTELGVDGVLLVRAARSVVRWDERRAGTALDRLRRVAREAAAQCRRARVPVVDGPVDVDELATRRGVVLADPAGVPVDRLAVPGGDSWVVAVGPEGGFDDAELAALGPVPRLALGPHVLRAETAAIAAGAALVGRRGY